MYTVKEAARITGLTGHAVRFYTDKGLVPGLKRDGNNNRLFDDEAINWLHGVKCLKASGMSIKAIKAYIELCLQGDATIPQRYALIVKHKEEALARLEEAKRHVAHLEEKVALYQDIRDGRPPDTTNPLSWERIRHMHGDVFYTPAVRNAVKASPVAGA